MASVSSNTRQVSVGKQIVMAVGGGLFCIALVVVAIMMRSGEPAKEGRVQNDSAIKDPGKRSLPPMNLALGNVVTVVPELGLTVKGNKGVKVETSRLATKIESQLASLREFYRSESETHPSLMGGLLLELAIGTSGDVLQVKEISTRITEAEFRKSVIAQVYNWEFQDFFPDGATILCPLLFVREGMDITTLVKWEKHLGLFEDKNLLSRASPAAAAVMAPGSAPANPNVEGKAVEILSEKNNALAQVSATPQRKHAASNAAAGRRRQLPPSDASTDPSSFQEYNRPLAGPPSGP
jgi:hypothetical protein